MAAKVLGNPTLYHSGQVVPISNWYELVGGTGYLRPEKIRVYCQYGDLFPDYDGRAVSWCLHSTVQDTPAHDDDQQLSLSAGQKALWFASYVR